MRRLRLLYSSMVGKKAIAAVTGAILLGFLVFHAMGNLKAFLPDAAPGLPDIDVYARFLRTMGEPLLPRSAVLWAVRIVLLAAFVLHVACVTQLAAHNRRARPVRYARTRYVEATPSGRWMLYSGALVLVFVGLHLPHLTTGDLDPAHFTHGAVYANLERAFAQWPFAALYVASMIVLGSHLYHGAWSAFQSLGLDNPDRNRALRGLAVVLALVLPLVFASVPVAFFSGMMAPAPAVAGDASGGHE